MKKLFFQLAVLFLYLLATVKIIYANNETHGFVANSTNYSVNATYDKPVENIATRAIKDFKRTYKGAKNPVWTNLNEKGFVCRFYLDDVLYRACYTNNGTWKYSIASYEENKLPKPVRNMVKSVYYDFDISYVNEISSPLKETVYLIQIQDQKTLNMLRVSDGEMELIQELQKSN